MLYENLKSYYGGRLETISNSDMYVKIADMPWGLTVNHWVSLFLFILDPGSGLGFNIRGGVDHPHLPYDPGIFITTVKEQGIAARDGHIEPGDKILEVLSSVTLT